MKLWSILGNSQKLDGGAMFGNVPKGMWEKWIRPDEQNRIPLACRALLADGLNGKRVLFETGIGAFFEPKLRDRYGVQEDRHVLLDSLRAAGLPMPQNAPTVRPRTNSTGSAAAPPVSSTGRCSVSAAGVCGNRRASQSLNTPPARFPQHPSTNGSAENTPICFSVNPAPFTRYVGNHEE